MNRKALLTLMVAALFGSGNLSAATNEKEIAVFKKQAEEGDAELQHAFGLMYLQGNGVDSDAAEGARFMLMAANQAFKDSEYFMGCLYLKGIGVDKSEKNAFKWMVKASEKGFTNATRNVGNMYQLGVGVEASFDKSFDWGMKYSDLITKNESNTMLSIDICNI